MNPRTIFAGCFLAGFCILMSVSYAANGGTEDCILVEILMPPFCAQYYRIEIRPETARLSYIKDTLGHIPAEPVALQGVTINHRLSSTGEVKALAARLTTLRKDSVIRVPGQNGCPPLGPEVSTAPCLIRVSAASAAYSQYFLDGDGVLNRCVFGQPAYSKNSLPKGADGWETIFQVSYLCIRDVRKRIHPIKQNPPYLQFCRTSKLQLTDAGEMLCQYLGEALMGVPFGEVGKLLRARDATLQAASKAAKKENVRLFEDGFSDFKTWVRFQEAKKKPPSKKP